MLLIKLVLDKNNQGKEGTATKNGAAMMRKRDQVGAG